MGEYIKRGEGGAEGNYFLMTDKDLGYCSDVTCDEVCWESKALFEQASLNLSKTSNGSNHEL